ncbi:MAG: heme exporter protein CcmB [Anaerolineales bacterium]|jgi:heme exporter protein B|nr:MAG: heme exporter protein CcmB [Anaerolineales bacterium]
MRYLHKIFAVIAKDVVAELRTREMLSSMFVFSLLVILIFNFAFDLRAENQRTLAPGVLWVAIAFAGMLGLSRSFIMEKDRGSMEGLLLTPVDRSAIYLGKMLGNVLFITVVEIIILPIFVVLFNLSAADIPWLLGVMLLGTIGFAGVGTLFSAMAIHTRAREVLLPVLLFPVVIPVMLAAVKLTAAILDRLAFDEVQNWFSLLVAFDLIFMALAFILFDYVMEE